MKKLLNKLIKPAKTKLHLKVIWFRIRRFLNMIAHTMANFLKRLCLKAYPLILRNVNSVFKNLNTFKLKFLSLWEDWPISTFLVSSIIILTLCFSLYTYSIQDELNEIELEQEAARKEHQAYIQSKIINAGEFTIPQDDLDKINADVIIAIAGHSNISFISSYIKDQQAYYYLSYEKLLSYYYNSALRNEIESEAYEICWDIIKSWQDHGYISTAVYIQVCDSRNLERVIFEIPNGSPISYRVTELR